ncbi:hypothetical protein EJ03DRAFT_17323 [Teratosphaeria nubilosa]|uniref:Uncharacterized protein n=1 Tax=Teratosphaeria nubilosa TaxID=161662 RepID=A0A6G1KVQ6_9PEZI|nr:hypothetical protein EJ03DRAFT_17323 [Teratosphaeria nubilosa]
MRSPPSLLHRYGNDLGFARHLALPIVLLLSTVFASLQTAPRHSLLTGAVAWTSICAVCSLKVGVKSLVDATQGQRLAWATGALLALAAIEERAAGGKYGGGIWWAKVHNLREDEGVCSD